MTPEINDNGMDLRENSCLIKNVFFSSVGLKMKLANLSSITFLVFSVNIGFFFFSVNAMYQ